MKIEIVNIYKRGSPYIFPEEIKTLYIPDSFIITKAAPSAINVPPLISKFSCLKLENSKKPSFFE